MFYFFIYFIIIVEIDPQELARIRGKKKTEPNPLLTRAGNSKFYNFLEVQICL